MAKSELDLEEERRLAENRKATQSKGIGSEILDKIKNNPWKTLGTVLLAAAFPAGTIIAGAIATGVVAKSGYDAHVNNKVNQGKGEEPRGMLSELGQNIKNNPWKTLGTVLLAAVFPAGTIIAGAIATAVVAKSGYDAHVNNKVNQGTGEVSSHKVPPHKHPKPNYSQNISPSLTPSIRNTTKSEVISR